VEALKDSTVIATCPISRRFDAIIGKSARASKAVVSKTPNVSAPTDSTVLLQGRNQARYGADRARDSPHHSRWGKFVVRKLNCAAIPFDLLESELSVLQRCCSLDHRANRGSVSFEMADKGTHCSGQARRLLQPALNPNYCCIYAEHEFRSRGSTRLARWTFAWWLRLNLEHRLAVW